MNDPSRPIRPGTRRFTGAADIHSHPLPGIDDGAATLEASLRMAQTAARFGTTLLVATPHRYWDGHENRPDRIRALTSEVQEALAATKFGHRIEVVAGQEIRLTPDTAFELRHGDVLTIGDTGVYALVEPPFDHLPDWFAQALRRIVTEGIRPVLAHPERNAALQQDPELSHALIDAGALFQVTAMSILGENGSRAQATARWMLDRDLATVVASDSHSPTWRPPDLRTVYRYLCKEYGTSVAQRLVITNPQAIATGQSQL